MMNALDSSPQGDDRPRKLGARFFILWGAALAALVASNLVAMRIILPRADEPWGGAAIGLAAFLFAVGMIAVCVTPSLILGRRNFEDEARPAQQRYAVRFSIGLVGYFGVLYATLGAATRGALPEPLAWAAAFATAAFVLYIVHAVQLIPREEKDEFLRERFYHAAFHGTVGAMAICTVWGLLDEFQLVPGAKLWAVFPIWAVCYGVAQVIEKQKYT